MNNNSKRCDIMGVPVDAVTMDESLDIINKAIDEKNKLHIVTINAEMIMLTKEDNDFFSILKKSGLLIPDGSGVVWALRKQGVKVKKLPGIELAQSCISNLKNARIFMFGGHPDVIKTAYEKLEVMFPQNNIVGYLDGYFKPEDEENIIRKINESNADILLIGLGVPRQEKWIDKNKNKLKASVFIGVGGSFDVFSGKIKRAPLLMQKLHLEWLYRLYKEPWRWRRMMALPKFVGAVYMEKK